MIDPKLIKAFRNQHSQHCGNATYKAKVYGYIASHDKGRMYDDIRNSCGAGKGNCYLDDALYDIEKDGFVYYDEKSDRYISTNKRLSGKKKSYPDRESIISYTISDIFEKFGKIDGITFAYKDYDYIPIFNAGEEYGDAESLDQPEAVVEMFHDRLNPTSANGEIYPFALINLSLDSDDKPYLNLEIDPADQEQETINGTLSEVLGEFKAYMKAKTLGGRERAEMARGEEYHIRPFIPKRNGMDIIEISYAKNKLSVKNTPTTSRFPTVYDLWHKWQMRNGKTLTVWEWEELQDDMRTIHEATRVQGRRI